jgi:hypothetical protein
VSNGSWVLVDLVVVTALRSLITEEMDCGVCDPTRKLGFVLQMLQTVGLIPTRREYVERDLSTNRVTGAIYRSAMPLEVIARSILTSIRNP